MSDRRTFPRGLRRILFSLPVLIAALALAAYALAGFYLVPYLVSREIPRFAAERLQAKAEIGEVRVNPFLLTAELRGFKLAEKDDRPVLAFDRLFLDLEVSSLLRWAWTVTEISLDGPQLHLDIDGRGELNLATLAHRIVPPETAPAPKDEETAPRLWLRHVDVTRGRMAITDRSGPTPGQAQIEPVAFELKDISTLPDHRGDHTLSARLPAGGTLAWRGKLSLQPIAAEGEVHVKDLKLATLWRFLQDELRVEEPAGSLALDFRYGIRHADGALALSASDIALRGAEIAVKLRGAASPILGLAEVGLTGGAFDLAQRRLSFAQLALRRGEGSAALDEAGTLDWQGLIAPLPEGEKPPPVSGEATGKQPWRIAIEAVRIEEFALRVVDGTRVQPIEIGVGRADAAFALALELGASPATTIDGLSVQLAKLHVAQQGAASPLITLDAAELDGGRVDVAGRTASISAVRLSGGETQLIRDANSILNLAHAFQAKRPAPPSDTPFVAVVDSVTVNNHKLGVLEQMVDPAIRYDLEGISARLSNVASDGSKPFGFELATKVQQGGTLKATGSFDLARTRAVGQISASRISVLPLEPLLAQQVVLKLASGTASADGRVTWELDREFGQRLAFRGSAALDDLLLNDAAGERFFACQSIAASRMSLDLRAQRLGIEDVHLVAPAGKIVINKDRSTNLATVLRQPQKPPPAQEKPEPAPSQKFLATIDRVRVEKGGLDFADFSLVLPFSTHIRELSGSITGLASEPRTRAGVKLEGQVEEYGLARIDGTINLFAPRSHTDLTVAFRNVLMTPFSPYSATFAGRRIASGRLALDLQYKVENSELRGENKVVLEQFTLGERVESPGALSLPLDLAIALLTDSSGKIDIAVPVRGNVDSPEFSYGELVWQAIRNLVTRIVTAPFRALAALFGAGGGGENLDEIVFDPGSARLLPPEREKLVRLADTLKQRPQVRLLVQGRYHLERDGGALRDVAARRAVAEQRGIKLAPGEDPGLVPYENARTQRALEVLLGERGGADALAQFVAAFEKQKGREAQRVNRALALVGRGSPDRELYEAMFARIAELQPLPANALDTLAGERGAAIAKQVAEGAGIGPERVAQQTPEAVSGAQVTSKLTLDVAKVVAKP